MTAGCPAGECAGHHQRTWDRRGRAATWGVPGSGARMETADPPPSVLGLALARRRIDAEQARVASPLGVAPHPDEELRARSAVKVVFTGGHEAGPPVLPRAKLGATMIPPSPMQLTLLGSRPVPRALHRPVAGADRALARPGLADPHRRSGRTAARSERGPAAAERDPKPARSAVSRRRGRRAGGEHGAGDRRCRSRAGGATALAARAPCSRPDVSRTALARDRPGRYGRGARPRGRRGAGLARGGGGGAMCGLCGVLGAETRLDRCRGAAGGVRRARGRSDPAPGALSADRARQSHPAPLRPQARRLRGPELRAARRDRAPGAGAASGRHLGGGRAPRGARPAIRSIPS